MEEYVQLCYSVLAPISVTCEILLIYSFWRLNQFKNHPEIIILWQCLGQFVVDIHWFTGISWLHEKMKGQCCLLLGSLVIYFYYLAWDYTLCLSIEVLLKLLNPQNTGYKKRMLLYHLASHVSSTLIFIIVAVSGTDGESLFKTCCVQHGSPYELIMAIPVILHFPICIFIVGYSIYVSSDTFYASHLKYHMIVVGAFCVTWVPMGLTHGLSYSGFKLTLPIWLAYVIFMQASSSIGVSSGLVVFSARMMQRGLFKKVLLSVLSPSSLNKSREINVNLNDDKKLKPSELSYSEFFNHATIEGIRDLLVVLQVIMKKSETETDSIQEIRYWKLKIGQYNKNVQIAQHHASTFEAIMKKSKIWYSDIINSFSLDEQFEDFHQRLNFDENSKLFSFFTTDFEFIVKSITSTEMMSLKSIIHDYSQHVSSEKGSFLAKVFGLWKIKIEGANVMRIILIENQGSRLFNPVCFHLDGRLGLKATPEVSSNRELEDLNRKIVYEDKDFFEFIGKFSLSHLEHDKILQVVQRDTKFLQKHLLVEYFLKILVEKASSLKESLIQKEQVLSFGKFVVFVGIVEFLQVYDVQKKIGKIGKKKFEEYFKCDEFCPKSYRKRFLFMVEKVFQVDNIN